MKLACDRITMQDFRQLDAFRLADELAYAVYVASSRWPRHEIWGLTDQVRRAAVSIPSNIAEGCGRHSRADYLRFLDAATGSAFELEYQLTLAQRLGYMDADSAASLLAGTKRVSRVLTALVSALRGRRRHDRRSSERPVS